MINSIASTTFGIYLFHDSGVMRQLIWNNILQVGKQYSSDLYPILALISVGGVFLASMIVDLIRMKIFEPTQNKIYEDLKRKLIN